MKKYLSLIRTSWAVVLLLSLNSCSSGEPEIASSGKSTILGIATTNQPSLTTFVTAVNRFPDLVTLFNSSGNFTVFIPSNAAFSAFLASTPYATVNDVPLATLREILSNHVVAGSYTTVATANATTVSTGYLKTLAKGNASSTNTLSLYLNISSTDVRLNGVSSVTSANNMATNGVVHLVDAVIGLPTILTHTKANSGLSTLTDIITSASGIYGNQSSLALALATNATPLTVFAPTNDAFKAAFATGAWANGVTGAGLTKVVQYHVSATGNLLGQNLQQNQVLAMITTPILNTTIDLNGGVKIKDTQSNSASIVVTDVQCANGILHIVDKVLRPF